MAFLSSTNRLKELKILQEIEKRSEFTQKELGLIVGAAPSMINLYLNEFEAKGYIKKIHKSPKSISYEITRAGEKRKDYLLVDYIHEILGLYDRSKKQIEQYLREFDEKDNRRLILYGSGVVAHTLLWVLRDMRDSQIEIVGIVDDDESKQGDLLMGYEVASARLLKSKEHDAVLITAYLDEEKIVDRLKLMGYKKPVLRFFNLKEQG